MNPKKKPPKKKPTTTRRTRNPDEPLLVPSGLIVPLPPDFAERLATPLPGLPGVTVGDALSSLLETLSRARARRLPPDCLNCRGWKDEPHTRRRGCVEQRA